MRTSTTLIGCLAALLLAAACGGSAPSSGSLSTTPAATRVVVSYPIARVIGSPGGLLARCPSGATCKVERDNLGLVIRRPRWVLIVSRTLSCGATASGEYADPAAACRAFEAYAHARLRIHAVCFCALIVVPQAEAVGSIDGRRDTLTMGPCGGCGLGRKPLVGVRVLTPGALAGSAVA